MRKAVRICCLILGAVLLMSALFLVLYNIAEDKKSGETAEHVLDALRENLPETQAPETTAPAMP